MNSKCLELCKGIVDSNFINLASNALKSRENALESLLSQRRLPDEGWDELQIEWTMNVFAAMDSNNFPNNIGAGEREARIFSNLVYKRSYGLGHGIGRSGDVAATQPKAAGSSMIISLCKYLVKDALKVAGYIHVNSLILLPTATGLSLSLCFLSLKQERRNTKYVILSRIDQKTCLKCIVTAGLEPIVLEPRLTEDSYLECDYERMETTIKEIGEENICCVMAITSCFSPRTPDNAKRIAEICKKTNVPCVINNAYGIQCPSIANSIENAVLRGRVDYVVQSMDKNFMVPVGGAVVFSPSKERIKSLSMIYPGRATSAPIVDLFITLLQMGKNGFKKLLSERTECYNLLKEKLQELCKEKGMLLIHNPKNKISLAVSLMALKISHNEESKLENIDSKLNSPLMASWNNLGGMLYNSGVSGARVITNASKTICGIEFKNYGSHCNNFPLIPYFNVAAAIGISKEEVESIIKKVEDNIETFLKKKI